MVSSIPMTNPMMTLEMIERKIDSQKLLYYDDYTIIWQRFKNTGSFGKKRF